MPKKKAKKKGTKKIKIRPRTVPVEAVPIPKAEKQRTRHTYPPYKGQDISVHVRQESGQWFPIKVLVTSANQQWPIDQYILRGFPTEDEAAEYGCEAAKWRIDHPQTSRGPIKKLNTD
jgi:hypothetical protein